LPAPALRAASRCGRVRVLGPGVGVWSFVSKSTGPDGRRATLVASPPTRWPLPPVCVSVTTAHLRGTLRQTVPATSPGVKAIAERRAQSLHALPRCGIANRGTVAKPQARASNRIRSAVTVAAPAVRLGLAPCRSAAGSSAEPKLKRPVSMTWCPYNITKGFESDQQRWRHPSHLNRRKRVVRRPASLP
jgi:hypothetical protein